LFVVLILAIAYRDGSQEAQMGYPSIYPTGTTIYDPDQCWNGYTIFQAKELGATLIDMNGRVVQLWEGLQGMPNSIFVGRLCDVGSAGERAFKYGFQDNCDLVQVDWDGNIIWKFDQYEYIEDPGEEPCWMARQHHDFQREGCPVGYFVPEMLPRVDGGNTLIIMGPTAVCSKLRRITISSGNTYLLFGESNEK
jgi:hypothetical protein